MTEDVSLKKRPPPPPGKKPQMVKQQETASCAAEPSKSCDGVDADQSTSGVAGTAQSHSTSTDGQPQGGGTQHSSSTTTGDSVTSPPHDTPVASAATVDTLEQAIGKPDGAITQSEADSVDHRTDSAIVAAKSHLEPGDHRDNLRECGESNAQIKDQVATETDGQPECTLQTLQEQLSQLQSRIKSLEENPAKIFSDINERLELLEDDFDESDSGDEESDTDHYHKALSYLNIISIADWDKRDFSRKKPHALIDVVVSPSFFQGLSESSGSSMKTAIDVQDRFDPDGDHGEYVKFVQVNSSPLLHLYNHVIGGSHASDDELTIIFAPFKTFTAFLTEFRQVMDNLESTWESKARDDSRAQITVRVHEKPSEKDKRVESDKIADSEKSANKDNLSQKDDLGEEEHELYEQDDFRWDSYEAYIGGKAWDEFYHRFVKKRWDWFRSNRVTEIMFGDLCNFYQPGDIVYEPDAEQKVWRVTKITGGRPVLQTLLYGSLDGEEGGGKRVRSSAGDGSGGHRLRNEDDKANESKRQVNDYSLLFVEGYYLNFDGTTYGPVHKREQIKYYPGKRSVKGLKMWPLRLLDRDQQKIHEITKAGVTFFEKCLPALHHYDGRTLTKSPSGIDLSVRDNKFRAQDLTSAVYVDLLKAYQNIPEWEPDFGTDDFVDADKREIKGGTDNITNVESKFRNNSDEDSNFYIQNFSYAEYHAHRKYRKEDQWIREPGGYLTEDRDAVKKSDWILFPNRLCGFVFQTRSWACFDVDASLLKEVPKDDSAWAELALPQSYKDTLESLVELHFANKKAAATRGAAGYEYDFIHGKGAGLVVLLHGHPGVGKTSTAESIAAKYQKPLLPITCGNLGIDAQRVEEALTENFQLAQAWDAIVLLDEADVFLSRRDKMSVERNALVSVFLRTLEYYTGVLFLTTNRVGAFDGAFISRVHASLYYDALSLEQTDTIWTNNLERLIRQGNQSGNQLKLTRMGEDIMSFARKHFISRSKHGKARVWNGRQIRNSFQSAVALAQHEAKHEREKNRNSDRKFELTAKHFAVVAEASAQFEDYLKTTWDHTEEEIMDKNSERAKDYVTPAPCTPFRGEFLEHDYEETYYTTPSHPNSTPRMMNAPNGQQPVKKPTLNSRLQNTRASASPQAQRPINGLPGIALPAFAQPSPSQQVLTHPRAPPLSGVPAGFTIIMNEQNQPQLVPIQNAETAQPTMFQGHVDTYQHFDHQTVTGDTIKHNHGDTVFHANQWNPLPSQSYTRSPVPQNAYIKTEDD